MAEYRTITVRAVLSDAEIKAGVTLSDMTIAVTPALSAPIKVTDLPPYTGATVVTPSEQVQTLETAGTAMFRAGANARNGGDCYARRCDGRSDTR